MLRVLPQITSPSRFHISAIFVFFSIANLSPYLDTPQDLLNRKNQILRKHETDLEEVICGRTLKVSLPKKFYIFLGIMLVFSIGNSSDAFLILRSQDLGVALFAIPLVYALFNFVYASASIPLGSLSDKIGRQKVIILGWIAFSLSYFGFAFANASYQAWLLFAFYGLYYATTEGVAKAFVADMIPSDHRGRAYGIYNTAIGLSSLPASFIAGILWDKVSPSAPFFFGGTVSLFAVILLIFFSRKWVSSPEIVLTGGKI